jgi:serine/threonine protein kinase
MFNEEETETRMTKMMDKDDVGEKEDDFNLETHMNVRGTFVGTPLYASPEMLSCSISGPFTDLWALGVIVFQLYNGEVPWKSN